MTIDEHVLVVTGTHHDRVDMEQQLEWFFDMHFLPTRVVGGCARGVDLRARMYFKRRDIPFDVKFAVWRKNNIYNPYAGHDRNQVMIDAAPVTAHLIALPLLFHDRMPDWKRSPGTHDCYKRGRAKGLTCHVR